ncbi:DNA polymerase II [Proteobacteria bacterium 005FR1]|nr:DNA polymerase II [Proteobacteria bacterium 005FR1]
MQAFLLTRQWRDGPDGISLDLWFASDEGPVHVEITGQESVFFIREADLSRLDCLTEAPRVGEARLRNVHGQTVLPLYLTSQRASRSAADKLDALGIPNWEADVRPPERFLMERFVTGGVTIDGSAQKPGFFRNPRLLAADYRPRLKLVSLDIETSMDARQLFSIGVFGEGVRRVFMVEGESERADELEIIRCEDERSCLRLFLRWLASYDPDVIIGWNVIQFDCWVLESIAQTKGIALTLGRNKQKTIWREDEDSNRRYLQVPGRTVLDGIELMKAANYNLPSFSLENTARTILGEGKLLSASDRGQEITELFRHDKRRLAEYNLKDCELVWEIAAKTKLVEFAIERSQLNGLPLDRSGGSVAAFDYAYLPLLHRKGYVAPNHGELQSDLQSPGGYVLDSRPGIYRNVLVLDFKSLYPSIIRTFRVDPYAFWYAQHNDLPESACVPGFNGAIFARDEHLLPGIIERLWQARDRAKAEANAPLSQAIKIMMNSFYGVLGSTGCRFYDPRVCSSITLRGHYIIQTSREWIEEQGFEVIYGDTDSLFVWLGDEGEEDHCRRTGQDLTNSLNERWRNLLQCEFGVESALEIEFETHYLKFLMPTVRGSEQGSKKRYAGIVRDGGAERLVFKGLENVRTDWTKLAKRFQEELYRRVFAGEEVEGYVRSVAASVRSGEQDKELIYRKRLRRKLRDYQKNVPPHVQAARKLAEQGGPLLGRGDWIEYLVTVNGPEPVDRKQSAIDYRHYVDRQLAPVADGILHFIGLSFATITEPQLNLFE